MTSIAAEISMPSQTSKHLSSSTDNIVLGIHRGAIDQTTITTQPPSEVMKKLSNILQDMGVEMQEESAFRYRCIRPKKSSGEEDDADARSVSTVATTTTTTDGDRDVDAAVEGSEHIEKDNDAKGSDETRDSSGMQSTPSSPLPAATSTTTKSCQCVLYGSPPDDSGDEVRFSVEITQLAGLPGTYSVDVRRLKGNLRSYKYVYDAIRNRAQLNR